MTIQCFRSIVRFRHGLLLLLLFAFFFIGIIGGKPSTTFADEAAVKVAASSESTERLQFNRDIRPLLSDRCFLCHGPDQSSAQSKETDLRLDDRELAVDHGVFDFENIDKSEILQRITATDDDQMPPANSHKQRFSKSEIDLIRRWIEQL